MNRKEITSFLRELLIRNKLSGRGKYWASEVSIDYGTTDVKRVDFKNYRSIRRCGMDLYRGKLKKTGDWFVGAVVCMDDKAYGLVSDSLLPERPAYSRIAIGYGLRDGNLLDDGTEAAKFGWEQALKRYEDKFPQWEELEPETVTRCTDRHDVPGNVLFEGDIFRNPDNLLFEICYGKYMAFCPADGEFMENIGFFAVSKDVQEIYNVKEPMPLGYTEEYAFLVGNIFDNPELRQEAGADMV